MNKKNETFEEVAMPYINSVYRAAVALCGKPDEAEDLTQATFLKAFEQFGSFRPGTNCKAWLLRILRNKWIDRLRHRKIAGPSAEIDESLIAAPESIEPAGRDELLENFSDEQVINALKSLPAEQRMALYLTDVEQLSQQEVAEILNVAVGTVKSRTSRARATLKTILFSHALEMGWTGGE